MTREEAISTLEMLRFPEPWEQKLSKRAEEALDMAISALSENKGDLISRGEVQSVLHNNLHALIDTDQLYQLYRDINHLTTYSFSDSDENKGEWIYTEDRPDGFCSKCDHDIDEASTPYCPYCGAKNTWVGAMRKPYKAESEGTE